MKSTKTFDGKIFQLQDIVKDILVEPIQNKSLLDFDSTNNLNNYTNKKSIVNLRQLETVIDLSSQDINTLNIKRNLATIPLELAPKNNLPILLEAVPQDAFSGDSDNKIYTFGDDDRVLAGNTDWDQKIAFITVEKSDGTGSGFTGALISPFHILTVAHGLYNKNTGFIDSDTIKVSLGQDGTERYYGTANAVSYKYFTGYTNDSNWKLEDGTWKPQSFNDDMAIITLDRNIGNFTGSFGYKYNTDDNYFKNSIVNTAGYPSDLAEDWSWNDNKVADVDLYLNSDPITEVSDEIFRYKLDIAGGQSGSPVWQYYPDTGKRQIVGVHSFGSTSSNGASRITKGKFDVIKSTVEEQTRTQKPIDKPDFVDYDDWFGTDFAYFRNNTTGSSRDDLSKSILDVAVGDSITFNSIVRNNGTARVDNGLYLTEPRVNVSFYASTNDFISSFDHKLGDVSISTIDPFDWSNATLNTAFPNIPEGDYHIGYTFGSITSEFDTTNNTGIIDGSKIRVVHEKDLSGYSFDVVQEPLKAGDSFDINFAIENSEASTAGQFEVDFYLSSDSTISYSDRNLGSYSIRSLLGNSNTGNLTTQLTLPDASDPVWNGSGNYYIGMIVDAIGQVKETNESNNKSVGEFIDYDGVNITIANSILGTSKKDILLGTTNDDSIDGLDGNDKIAGDAGNDTLYGSAGKDELEGGAGDDYLYGGADSDKLFGDDGDDYLYGDSGKNELKGGIGDDVLFGGDDKDKLDGGDGNDELYGRDGDDRIKGQNGNDELFGDSGKDKLNGGDGDDYLAGGSDNDKLDGDRGNDQLTGDSGDDTLKGDRGDDLLSGDSGDDYLEGGSGADKFIFYFWNQGTDTIKDFDWEEGDLIEVYQSGFGTGSQFSYDDQTGNLFFDGSDTVSSAYHIATLANTPSGFDINQHLDLV